MKKVDYIIVGLGLAGINFCEVLIRNNKSFLVIDNASQQSSVVAGGLYNPVVLKRFTEVWKANEQLEMAIPAYNRLENLLNSTLDYKIPVRRLFNSVEEQNNWTVASDKPNLSQYLSTKFITNENQHIKAGFGFGEVLETGRIDTSKLVSNFKHYLQNSNQFIEESFNHDALKDFEEYILYENIQASDIVFAECFGVKQKPFFYHLPLNGSNCE